ncbi:MAG: dienelactone hydrolase family protein [Anaerovorax sp.]
MKAGSIGSVKFYKRLIIVVFTIVLLIPTIIVSCVAVHYKASLNEVETVMADVSESVIVSNKRIGDNTILESYVPSEEGKPLVIVQHGITTNRVDVLKTVYKLAEAGFFVVAPDLYGHGERKKQDERALVMQGAVITSKGYDQIIEHYAKDKRCNTEKFGLTGFSVGGMVVFHYATYGKYRPTAIAPCISTPDWAGLETSYLAKTMVPTGTPDLPEDEPKKAKSMEVLENNSPMNEYMNMKDMHILMQNGGEDPIIGTKGITNLYNLLHKEGTDISFIVHPKQGHTVPDNNVDNIVAFMKEHLQ